MINLRKEERRATIEAAALGILAERGFAGLSMLAVAKAAGASNETLYKWYGDKVGLLSAMIVRDFDEMLAEVEPQLATVVNRILVTELEVLGRGLLALLMGERSVALHRAAAADATGTLGRIVCDGMRSKVLPRISDLLARHGPGADRGAELFLSVLMGDWHLRRVTGAMVAPAEAGISMRAKMAAKTFLVLWRSGVVVNP